MYLDFTGYAIGKLISVQRLQANGIYLHNNVNIKCLLNNGQFKICTTHLENRWSIYSDLRAGTYVMSNACIVILINISLLFQLQDFLFSFQKVE